MDECMMFRVNNEHNGNMAKANIFGVERKVEIGVVEWGTHHQKGRFFLLHI